MRAVVSFSVFLRKTSSTPFQSPPAILLAYVVNATYFPLGDALNVCPHTGSVASFASSPSLDTLTLVM
jgi:hypothetical protein